jgi:hypothetical protein
MYKRYNIYDDPNDILVDYMLNTLTAHTAVYYSSIIGNMNLVNYFVGKRYHFNGLVSAEDIDWSTELHGAAKGNHMDLVHYFISNGATNWNFGMCGAAEGGHMDLVLYFVNKGGPP